jgi:hypothetical protein
MNKYFSIIISLTLIYSNASCSSEEERSSSGGSYQPVIPSQPVYQAPIAPSEPVYQDPTSSYTQQQNRKHLQESKEFNEDTKEYLQDLRHQRLLDGTCKFGEYYNKTSERCE